MRNFLKCQTGRASVLSWMLSGLNMHARHMACRSNVSPRTPFPTLITRELLNDNVNIDHSSAKHRRTVWLVGQAGGGRPMIFFFLNFPHPSFIPFCILEKSSHSAVFGSYLPVLPSPLHLFQFLPNRFPPVTLRTSFAIFTDWGASAWAWTCPVLCLCNL